MPAFSLKKKKVKNLQNVKVFNIANRQKFASILPDLTSAYKQSICDI